MMTDVTHYAVRPPKQERSRLAWQRVLSVGLEILESEGVEAVTIKEVCRRAEVTPPSLYARVDGLAGLLAAVYDYALISVRRTEEELLAALPDPDASIEARVFAVVSFLDETFSRHRSVLQPIVASSMHHGVIHPLGTSESTRVQGTMTRALALPRQVAEDIAAMTFAEVVIRNVYGPGFAGPAGETQDEFRARLTRMGVARAAC